MDAGARIERGDAMAPVLHVALQIHSGLVADARGPATDATRRIACRTRGKQDARSPYILVGQSL